MEPEKVSAVAEWSRPTNRKQIQRFLGFANFYRRFIRGFSTVAAPLHTLTSSKVRFVWTPEAERAFQDLKLRFTSAPILILPDPMQQFVVEVDASDMGVGAVLSQRSSKDNKLHPCAFLSRKLSQAERNYLVGERELLAIKVALEEWRHWLEGAEVPFVVWTDHKNLKYLKSAKRLNSRQARWNLFFNRFNFHLSYRPGSQNIKPDALSRIFDQSAATRDPGPIVPESCMVGAMTWEIASRVKQALVGSIFQKTALRTDCSFSPIFEARLFIGAMHDVFPAIRESGGLFLFYPRGSVGLPWRKRWEGMWPLVIFVLVARFLGHLLLAFCILFPYPLDPGLTFL